MRGLFGVELHPVSGTYRVRLVVPDHLRPIVGQTAFTRTLGTKDEALARRRAPEVLAALQRVIAQAQTVFEASRGGEAEALIALTPGAAVDAVAAWATNAGAQMAEAIWRRGRNAPLGQVFPEFGSGGPLAYWRERHHAAREFLCGQPLPPDHGAALLQVLRRIMSKAGVLVPPGDHPATMAALGLVENAVSKLAEQQRALSDGEWALPDPAAPHGFSAPPRLAEAARPPSSATDPPAGHAFTVLEMMEAHIRRARPSTTSEKGLRLAVRRLLAFMGQKDVDAVAVTHRHADDLHDLLGKLPANMRPDDWTRGLHVLARDYDQGRDDRPRLSPASVGKDIGLLHAMWAYAVARRRLPDQVFGRLVSKRSMERKIRRLPFSAQQVERIFTAPTFLGCARDGNWRAPGPHLSDDHRFWLPIMAACMGIRIEEGAQLLVTDVGARDGVAYIDITTAAGDDDEDGAPHEADGGEDREKSLKTKQSHRRVPVHPNLVRLGFLDYVAARRAAGDTRLFPQLQRNANGKMSASTSQWFNRDFLPSVGIEHPSKTFHSFRHLWVDCAREADGIAEDVRRALCGHGRPTAHDGYGEGFSVQKLGRAMEQIVIPGFPLDRMLAARGRESVVI